MRIGQVAARAGIPVKTIRFWEAEGLLAGPVRTQSGYRDYDTEVIERLDFIRRAQIAGFRLDEIRQILDIGDSGQAACRHVRGLIDQRIRELDARIAELEATRARLEVLAVRAGDQNPADCQGLCSIIQPRTLPTMSSV